MWVFLVMALVWSVVLFVAFALLPVFFAGDISEQAEAETAEAPRLRRSTPVVVAAWTGEQVDALVSSLQAELAVDHEVATSFLADPTEHSLHAEQAALELDNGAGTN